jgi:hypothetical protein
MLKKFFIKRKTKQVMKKIQNGASRKRIEGALRRAYRDVSKEVSKMRIPVKISVR